MKQLLYHILVARHRQAAIEQLRELEQLLPSPRSRFALPFVFRGRGHFRKLAPRQNPVEIERLYELVCELAPRRLLEIGTARGGSLYLWTQAALADATIVSIDLPAGEFGGAYRECRTPFYESFARDGQSLFLVRADSHDPGTCQQLRDLLTEQPLDFAFIDGDHRYEGVKADFEQYGPLVRPGGMLAVHDILPRPDLPQIEVHRLWTDLRQRYNVEELIGPDGSGRKLGIGVVRIPKGGLGLTRISHR